MKYFQNVVSIVRDLQSPVCLEEQYKKGMRKDKDGFMDVEWCTSIPLANWDDLRTNFQTSNARKAISPTQFNHQSTRGHCIMTVSIKKSKGEKERVHRVYGKVDFSIFYCFPFLQTCFSLFICHRNLLLF